MNFTKISAVLFSALLLFNSAFSQPPEEKKKKKKNDDKVRTVTIPISILSKEELKKKQNEEFIEAGDIFVKEDGDEQNILSIKSVSDYPLHLAILIQDDLDSTFNLELKELGELIRKLPKGSRVMIAYMRSGSINIRQKFTEDLEKASKALRIITSASGFGPNNPYVGVSEALERFDALPTGRRAILLISDGLDASNGPGFSSPSQSIDLERAILKAQKRSVAIYSIFTSGPLTGNSNSSLILNAQGSLDKLSDETGGKAYFSGTGAPISMAPFFREIAQTLNRQFALTYLSTHMKKGFHRVQVYSTNPDIKIEHPKGYIYKR